MSSILDQFLLIGRETTYATPAALTRGIEGQADAFAINRSPLESIGFRAGMAAVRADRRKMITEGAKGKIDTDVMSSGVGLLLDSAFDTAVAAGTGATAAKTWSWASGLTGPRKSLTVQMARSRTSGDATPLDPFTAIGGVVTGWTIHAEVSKLTSLSLDIDYADVLTSVALGTPVYPAAGMPFDWTAASVSVAGQPVQACRVFEVTEDLKMDDKRLYLRNSQVKAQPVRNNVPNLKGSMDTDYQDSRLDGYMRAGTVVPISFVQTGEVIDGTTRASLTVTIPAAQFDGDEPQSDSTKLTTQKLPFQILHNGVDAPVTVTLVTLDTAL